MAAPNLYAHITFPTYQFHEFPKAVDLGEGVTKVVSDEAEELAVLAGARTKAEEADDREALLQACEVRGLKVDRRWATERVRAALEAGA